MAIITAIVEAIHKEDDFYLVWASSYLVIPLLSILYALLTGQMITLRLLLIPFLAIGVVYSTYSANTALLKAQVLLEDKIMAAGFIVVSTTFFFWLIVLGVNRLAEATGIMTKVANISVVPGFRRVSMSAPSKSGGGGGGGGLEMAPQSHHQAHQLQRTASASKFNNPSSIGIHSGDSGTTINQAPTPPEPNRSFSGTPAKSRGTPVQLSKLDVAAEIKDTLKARTLFNYVASVEDQNELSFSKGEILDILDNQGSWWHARKGDGTIGIVPSNYVKLL